jgi:hypothetical protein
VSTTAPAFVDSSIFALDFWVYASTDTTRLDPRVASTLFRSDNWDAFNGAVVNPLPSNQSLPTSMYLTAKPAWWTTPSWPPFDPSQPPMTQADGAAEYLKLPAGARWGAMHPGQLPTEAQP